MRKVTLTLVALLFYVFTIQAQITGSLKLGLSGYQGDLHCRRDEDIRLFMEEMFNKPGADEFLTPREVIRDFLNILSLIRQNPNIDKSKLISDIVIKDERPNSE